MSTAVCCMAEGNGSGTNGFLERTVLAFKEAPAPIQALSPEPHTHFKSEALLEINMNKVAFSSIADLLAPKTKGLIEAYMTQTLCQHIHGTSLGAPCPTE